MTVKTVTGTSGGADISLVTAKTVTGTSGGADISLVTDSSSKGSFVKLLWLRILALQI